MPVKSYEKGKFKVYMGAITRDLFMIIYLNGNHSQIIETRDMDYETATDIFDYLVEIDLKKTDVMLPDVLVEEELGFFGTLLKGLVK